MFSTLPFLSHFLRMDRFNSTSCFHDIRSRELNGFRVRKRSYLSDVASDFSQIGVLPVEHDGDQTPALAVSFCKAIRNCHILAVSDEDGYISLFDTRPKFPSSVSYQGNAETLRICDWVAHQNAVFDVCWFKEDKQILTASGDQTMKVWDIEEKKCIGILVGHTGSVKSMQCHPTNSDIILSGSRDGNFALWDLRSNSGSKFLHGDFSLSPSVMVNGAHLSPRPKFIRRGKAVSVSITAVLYLKDEFSIATAGAADSVVKFWDTRNMKSAVTQTSPHPKSIDKERRFHGISSLSQDLNGVFISASCMDDRIYLFNVLQLEKGPIKSFSGSRIETFYVKAAISPDASFIVSGSSDENAYIWKVNKPHEAPITLKNHDGEVTAVDWCAFEDGKMATASDDFTVKLWNTHHTHCESKRSPSSFRKRVMATPKLECRNLFENEAMNISKDSSSVCPSDEVLFGISLADPIIMPKISTPEGQKKFLSEYSMCDTFEKTPEAILKSPSSVLSPPSSLRRKTIKDYFMSSL